MTTRYSIIVVTFILALGSLPAWRPALAWTNAGEAQQTIASKLIASNQNALKVIFGSVQLAWQDVQTVEGDHVILVSGGVNTPLALLRSDAKGNTLWRPGQIILKGEGYRSNPSILADTVGGVFVAWRQSAPDAFVVARINPAGAVLWERPVTSKDVLHYDLLLLSGNSVLVVASNTQEVFMGAVGEKGTLLWSQQPLVLERKGSGHNPVSAGLFADETALVVWTGPGEKERSYFAQRIATTTGQPMWQAPVRLGPAPEATLALPPKPVVTRRDGDVTVRLTAGELGDAVDRSFEYTTRVSPDGAVVRIEKAIEKRER